MSKEANRRKKTIRSGMASSSKTRLGAIKQTETAKQAETSKQAETAKPRIRKNSFRPKNEGLAGASSITNQERSEQIRNSILIVFSLVLALIVGIGIGSRERDSVVDSAIDLLTENAPSEITRQALERAAIEGALKASGDQWANYFPSSAIDKLEERNSNILTGIGVTLKKARSGAIEIVKVISSTTAEKAGLLAGDQILEVNETDVQGASLATVGALIRGEIGRELQLRVLRNSEKIEFSVATERVNLNTVEGSQIDNGVAYLAISNFASGTSDEAKSAISSLDSRNGVILDLRSNPGGTSPRGG